MFSGRVNQPPDRSGAPFCGREWLFTEIRTWLADTASPRCFVVTGPPGSGKTAIAAQWAMLRAADTAKDLDSGVATHFCSAREGLSLEPINFAERISAQLASRFPEFAGLLKPNWNADKGDTFVVQQQVGTMLGGKTTAVELHYQGPSGERAFNALLRSPLVRWSESHPEKVAVILVDSLDASVKYNKDGEGLTIADLLAGAGDLPRSVRFLLTTRPDEHILRPLRRLGAIEMPLLAGQNDRRSAADVASYLEQRVLGSALAAKLTPELPKARLIDTVLSASGGNFLYAKHVMDSLEGRSGTITDTDIAALPATLRDLYVEHLELATRRTSWNSLSTLLGPLTVAQQPLFEADLASILQTPVSQVRLLLSSVSELLETDLTQPISQRAYALFHQSFADFLADPDSSEFWCEEALYHSVLARWCAAHGGAAGTPGKSVYAQRFRILHLFRAQLWTELFALLDSPGYLREQIRFDPTLRVPARDLTLGRAAAARDGLSEGEALVNLARLWRYSSSYCNLVDWRDSHHNATFQALGRLGRTEEAEGLIELQSSPAKRAQALIVLAMATALVPGAAAAAKRVWLRAANLTAGLSDRGESDYTFARLMGGLEESARHGFVDQELADHVLKITEAYVDQGGDRTHWAYALWLTCVSAPRTGTESLDLDTEFAWIDVSRQAALACTDAEAQAGWLVALSRIEALIGRAEAAQAVLQEGLAASPTASAKLLYASQFIDLGLRNEALDMLLPLHAEMSAQADTRRPGTIPGLEVRFGIALAGAGAWSQAAKFAERMRVGSSEVLNAVVAELCRVGDNEEALRVAGQLTARELEDMRSGNLAMVAQDRSNHYLLAQEAILTIVHSFASQGEYQRAVEIAQGPLTGKVRPDALAIISAEAAVAGSRDLATELLVAEDAALLKREAALQAGVLLPPLMDMFVDVDRFEEAELLLSKIPDQELVEKCRGQLAEARLEQGQLEQAMSIAEKLGERRLKIALQILLRGSAADPHPSDDLSRRAFEMLGADLIDGKIVSMNIAHKDPHEAADVYIALADLRFQQGHPDLALRFLFSAVDVLNVAGRPVWVPSQWAKLPARFARADRLDVAVPMMRRMRHPYDRTSGLIAFAKVAYETGRPDVAINMLRDAFQASRELHSFLLPETIGMSIDLRFETISSEFIDQIPATETHTLAGVAAEFAKRAQLSRAQKILETLTVEDFPGSINPLSSPYAEIALGLLGRDDLAAAEAIMEKITDKPDRVRVLKALGQAQMRAGRAKPAAQALITAGETWEGDRFNWVDHEQLRDVCVQLRKVAQEEELVQQVQTRWRMASSWEDLRQAVGWAHLVLPLRPELTSEIASAILGDA